MIVTVRDAFPRPDDIARSGTRWTRPYRKALFISWAPVPVTPGLFTLRGKELLERAEVVIYDGLVNRELLRFAPPTAEIIYGGKHDRTRCVSQAELNALLLAKALEGKRVVRLKGGDPFVFGRGGEEAEVLAAAGIPFEVVPGVSSVHSVPCYAGIPLTHRHHASSVTIVTGHDAPLRR